MPSTPEESSPGESCSAESSPPPPDNGESSPPPPVGIENLQVPRHATNFSGGINKFVRNRMSGGFMDGSGRTITLTSTPPGKQQANKSHTTVKSQNTVKSHASSYSSTGLNGPNPADPFRFSYDLKEFTPRRGSDARKQHRTINPSGADSERTSVDGVDSALYLGDFEIKSLMLDQLSVPCDCDVCAWCEESIERQKNSFNTLEDPLSVFQRVVSGTFFHEPLRQPFHQVELRHSCNLYEYCRAKCEKKKDQFIDARDIHRCITSHDRSDHFLQEQVCDITVDKLGLHINVLGYSVACFDSEEQEEDDEDDREENKPKDRYAYLTHHVIFA